MTLRRSLALGDVLCATVVADKMWRADRPWKCSVPGGVPHSRRCKNVASFTEPRGYAHINLDAAYENDPHRASKTFHRMFIDRANQQLGHSGINLGRRRTAGQNWNSVNPRKAWPLRSSWIIPDRGCSSVRAARVILIGRCMTERG